MARTKEVEAAEKAIAKYPEARVIAVQNFVISAPDNKRANYLNLQMDAGLYNWNWQTVEAIRYGLKLLDRI